jgi:hypothetical protein
MAGSTRSGMEVQMHGNERRLMLCAALVASLLPSSAAQRVTVAQLEQFLAAERAAHATDNDVAQKLISAELSERLTEVSLERIKADYTLGEFDEKRYWTNLFFNEMTFTNYHRFGSTVRMLDSATH